MVRKIDWDSQIGRRLRLRDLHIFIAVARHGSISKAARQLEVSQPAVSEVIAGLEETIGERLFDRDQRGVEPTRYGRALLQRSLVVFDELKQGIKDIEQLADPTMGELRVGCVDSIASSILPKVIEDFSAQYPQIVLHVDRLVTADVELMKLRERSLDVVLARYLQPFTKGDDDLTIETLFEDHLVIACGAKSRFARRSKVTLADLADEPWIVTPSDTANSAILADAFRRADLGGPKVFLSTYSIDLRIKLVATGRYVGAFARSIVHPDADKSIKILPIELPPRRWPIVLITLKHRTLNPVAQRFIEHLRGVSRSFAANLEAEQTGGRPTKTS